MKKTKLKLPEKVLIVWEEREGIWKYNSYPMREIRKRSHLATWGQAQEAIWKSLVKRGVIV